ncbi:MAG: HNH endonuclease signature motif containing protein [Thioalkalivibrio sp.]
MHWHEDDDGSALNVGRKTRSIPPAIRRALQRRDQGCRFPGCTAHKYVDAHHIHHWADGGETKLDNLVLLCRHHHRLVHEGGYGVRMTASGPKFTDSTGRTIAPVAETRFRGNVFALKLKNQRAGLEIDAETTISLWEGERMDDGMAVEGLLQLE